MYKTSFEYNLEEPVEVAVKGKNVEALSLVVYAPKARCSNHANAIFTEFKRAEETESTKYFQFLSEEQFNKMLEKSEGQEKKPREIDPDQVIELMTANGSDLDKCFFALKEILTSGNQDKPQCIIDDTKMTKPIYDELSYKDLTNILGLFITSFFVSSRSQKKKP